MKKLLISFAALPFLTSVALAGQPMTLTDSQMDMVAAGGYGFVNALASGNVDVSGGYSLGAYPNAGFANIYADISPYGPSYISLSAGAGSNNGGG